MYLGVPVCTQFLLSTTEAILFVSDIYREVGDIDTVQLPVERSLPIAVKSQLNSLNRTIYKTGEQLTGLDYPPPLTFYTHAESIALADDADLNLSFTSAQRLIYSDGTVPGDGATPSPGATLVLSKGHITGGWSKLTNTNVAHFRDFGKLSSTITESNTMTIVYGFYNLLTHDQKQETDLWGCNTITIKKHVFDVELALREGLITRGKLFLIY